MPSCILTRFSNGSYMYVPPPGYYYCTLPWGGQPTQPVQTNPQAYQSQNTSSTHVSSIHIRTSEEASLAPHANFSYRAYNDGTVSFVNQSYGSFGGMRWSFGDGSTSTATNPSHKYVSSGTYKVTLQLLDSSGVAIFGASTSKSVIVTVSGTASASFTYYVTASTIYLINTSSAAYTSAVYTVAPGITVTESVAYVGASPVTSYTYAANGVYDVTLSLNGGAYTSTQSVTITGVTGEFRAGLKYWPVDSVGPPTMPTEACRGIHADDEYVYIATYAAAAASTIIYKVPISSMDAVASGSGLTIAGIAVDTFTTADADQVYIESLRGDSSYLYACCFNAPNDDNCIVVINKSDMTVKQNLDLAGAGGGDFEGELADIAFDDSRYYILFSRTGVGAGDYHVRVVNKTAEPIDSTLTIQYSFGAYSATPTNGELYYPDSIEVYEGHVYILDNATAITPDSACINKYTTSGTYVSSSGYSSGNDAPTPLGSFQYDSGCLCVDRSGSPTHKYLYSVSESARSSAMSGNSKLQAWRVSDDGTDLTAVTAYGAFPVTWTSSTRQAMAMAVNADSIFIYVYVSPAGYIIKAPKCSEAAAPLLDLSISADVYSITAPDTVTFSADSTGWCDDFLWVFGDGTTSTEAAPAHTFNEPGSYQVTLYATNSTGTYSTSIIILAYDAVSQVSIAPPSVNFTADVYVGIAPLTVTFTNTSTGGSTYSWDFGDGYSSSSPSPSHVYTDVGAFTVSLTAYDTKGWHATATKSIVVSATTADPLLNPPVAVAYPDAYVVDAGYEVTFTVSSTTTTPSSYLWDFGDGITASSSAPTHSYESGGTYTVTLTVSNAYGSTTTSFTITVVDYSALFSGVEYMYILDKSNHRVNIYGTDGSFISSFGGYGVAPSKMINPSSIAVNVPIIG